MESEQEKWWVYGVIDGEPFARVCGEYAEVEALHSSRTRFHPIPFSRSAPPCYLAAVMGRRPDTGWQLARHVFDTDDLSMDDALLLVETEAHEMFPTQHGYDEWKFAITKWEGETAQ